MAVKRRVTGGAIAGICAAGVLVGVCVLLMAGQHVVPMWRRAPPQEGYANIKLSSADVAAKYSGAGHMVCDEVTIAPSQYDPNRDITTSCTSLCGQANRGNRMFFGGALSRAADAVMCKCCDPATRVRLVQTLKGSEACLPNVTFGISDPKSRKMYVKDGCSAMFTWADGKKFSCTSTKKKRVECAYDAIESSAGKSEEEESVYVRKAVAGVRGLLPTFGNAQ